ncbi:GMP/IMP nucleotidase [Pseudomonas neustonica]|uniref:GMP/IMP nucleotidase n=1 Tax=Pseudomonas neustonica TaxID=2487346 RepID=A0ABX9XLC1_9PSED|nr:MULTISPECIES: GMP/IMP nucleotidase [Pseudomonas]ROZ85755.1 GMP/IMP nucleotidase [Pseudomonas sp. SSM44]ROZ87609.1 GMP/IMP nucleotidase [Pseudomonas neustonica]
MPMLNWNNIDTVLLDMDGTLLDLHFDNHFWLEHMPARYARHHDQSLEWAKAEVYPMMRTIQGQLDWYCLDYWTRELGMPIIELKREIAHLISLRPGADLFLQALQRSGKQVVLITNAHRDSLSLKMERIELRTYFQRMISSHDYGYPKETPSFWQALRSDMPFDPERSLFIDDSLNVLRAARDYGIGHLLAVREPDSRGSARDTEEFDAVEDYAALIAGL